MCHDYLPALLPFEYFSLSALNAALIRINILPILAVSHKSITRSLAEVESIVRREQLNLYLARQSRL